MCLKHRRVFLISIQWLDATYSTVLVMYVDVQTYVFGHVSRRALKMCMHIYLCLCVSPAVCLKWMYLFCLSECISVRGDLIFMLYDNRQAIERAIHTHLTHTHFTSSTGHTLGRLCQHRIQVFSLSQEKKKRFLHGWRWALLWRWHTILILIYNTSYVNYYIHKALNDS